MIVPQRIPKADVERIAVGGLRSFFDVESVTKLLSEKHSVAASERHFVKLQAESIRYCLQQAMEYRDAALASTFSRPTLVYYSIMSLALCEILFKRDGSFRLAKLRQQHGHHGLELSVQTPAAFRGEVALEALSVRRLHTGTFAVWYETARSAGLFGDHSVIQGTGRTTGLRSLTNQSPLSNVPERVTLLDLARSCPTVYAESADLEIQSRLARATLESSHNRNAKTVTLNVTIHPTPPDVLNEVWKHFIFSPRCVDLVHPTEFESGGGFRLTHPDEGADYIEVKAPVGYMLQSSHCLLSTEEVPLNEFGLYYLASYIAGMFARYTRNIGREPWTEIIRHSG
jgi:hypothetical protein